MDVLSDLIFSRFFPVGCKYVNLEKVVGGRPDGWSCEDNFGIGTVLIQFTPQMCVIVPIVKGDRGDIPPRMIQVTGFVAGKHPSYLIEGKTPIYLDTFRSNASGCSLNDNSLLSDLDLYEKDQRGRNIMSRKC